MEALAARLLPWLECHQEPATDEARQGYQRDGPLLCSVYEMLVQLLQQYPGGVTEAVLLTQLQTDISRKGQKKLQQPHRTSVTSAAPLASCLGTRHKPAEEVLVHGTICDISTAVGQPGSQILQLSDNSTSSPVGMFVHSQHKPLLEGVKPLLTVGRRIRAVTTLVKQLGLPDMPPLMPTALCTICIPAAEWQQLLDSPEQLPGSFRQVYHLRDVMTGGLAALGQQERCTLNGWLAAAVVRVGAVEAGYQANSGASSRSWTTCSMTLCDAADAANTTSNGQHNSSSNRTHTVQWLLLDEAVKYIQLLQPGENIAMYSSTVRRYQQHPGGGAELVLESSSGLWLLVREDDNSHSSSSSNNSTSNGSNVQERGLTGSHAEPGSASQAAAFDSCMLEASGQQNMVICGVVSNLKVPSSNNSGDGTMHPMQDNSTSIVCCIADTAADMASGRSRPLEMQFEAGSRKRRKVLRELRDGHVLLLTRVSCQEQQQQPQQQQHDNQQRCLIWQESAGGAIQNLSRLPATLTTPTLQHRVTLGQSQQGGSCLQQPGLLVVSATVQAAVVSSCRLHRLCQRAVQWGTPSHMECGKDVDDILEDGAAAAVATPDANHYLWSCPFCGVECSDGETEAGFTGHVMLEGAAESGASAVQVQVDSSAWQGLQSAVGPAMEAKLSQADSSRLLQLAVTGQQVTAAVYVCRPFQMGISAWQVAHDI